jgi:hypothetical protein
LGSGKKAAKPQAHCLNRLPKIHRLRTALAQTCLHLVDNAAVIRDLIVERLRVYRDSGLGERTIKEQEPLALSAAREVLQETKALRNSIASGLRSTP